MFRLDDQQVYRAGSLEQFPWLEHGFGTRLSAGWPDLSRLVTTKQVHSSHVVVVPPDAPTGANVRFEQGDALVSAEAGQMIGIRTADCVPILIVGATSRTLGAIHAGWRGTVAGISTRAVETLTCQFGTSPVDIWAAIGPGIGPCCFEVGPEVAIQFRQIFPERMDLDRRTSIDLAEANRRLLLAAGVPASQIEVSGLCTVCLDDQFHSFRRDKEKAGRMISALRQKAQKARD